MVFRANMRRLIYIVTVIIRHAAAQSVHMLLTRWPRLAFSARFVRISGPERLRLFFEELGGTFIKFGQMLALQPDILSLEYCNALFDLLDRCTPFSYAELERIFIEETGKTPSEIFNSFEMRAWTLTSLAISG